MTNRRLSIAMGIALAGSACVTALGAPYSYTGRAEVTAVPRVVASSEPSGTSPVAVNDPDGVDPTAPALATPTYRLRAGWVPPVPDPIAVVIHWPRGAVVPEPAPPASPGPTAAAAAWPSTAPAAPTKGTWTFDLFDSRAQRYQEPDNTACTAAAALSMLNTIAYDGWDSSLIWQPTLSFARQEAILAFERKNMTMRLSSAGSDAHGWRNALNYFGWGSMTAGVYRDVAYASQGAAEKAVVSAVAKYRKPAGVLAQMGAHAQFVTGYKAIGEDPATGSLNFTVVGVFLTDPWRSARYRDQFVTRDRWRWGYTWLRFDRYRRTDSPYRDPIDGAVGRNEWLGKYVIVVPVV